MLDEEPGLQGVSAIDSRCARGEGASLRVADGALQEVALLVVVHGYPQPVLQRPGRSTTGRRGDRVSGFLRRHTHNSIQRARRGDRGLRVRLRRSGRRAGRRVEDGQGAVDARSQIKSHTATV